MSAYVELYIDQGTNFNNIINITDDVTNDYINVYGYIITSQLRRSYYSENPSANLICTITDAANGEVTLSMNAANTSLLKPGRFLFDVKSMDTNQVTSRLIEGIIAVTPGVTK